MTLSLVAIAVLNLTRVAPIEINANVKDGDTINGVEVFRVTVNSTDTVNQVEFYVGSDLRSNATSTPYTFTFDTISESDGPQDVSFAAYTAEGAKAKKTFHLNVDNLVSKGAAFHVQKANDLLSTSKWDAAIQEARIALKAQKDSNPARIAMARANLGKGVLDAAQKFAEDAKDSAPNDPEVLDLVADINLRKAFAAKRKEGGDNADTLSIIRDAMIAAVSARSAVLQSRLDKFGPVTDANVADYADTACRAGRFTLAIDAVDPVVHKDFTKMGLVDRLAYAQMRAGRYVDAMRTYTDAAKFGQPDAYGQALMAILYHQQNQPDQYKAMMTAAVLNDNEDLGVRTAQAYVALADNNNRELSNFARDLSRDQGQRTEVNYLLSALFFRLQNYPAAESHFEQAVLTEPTYFDSYIERANQSIQLALAVPKDSASARADEIKQEYASADIMFDAALAAKPDSATALAGKAIVQILLGKASDSLRWGRAASEAAPSYAAGWYALAAACTANDLQKEAQSANLRAGKLDQARLEGREAPDVKAAWIYYATAGRTPLITPPPPMPSK